jgi:hypothetical protein
VSVNAFAVHSLVHSTEHTQCWDTLACYC